MLEDYGAGDRAVPDGRHVYYLENSHGRGRPQILVYEAGEVSCSVQRTQLYGRISALKA